MFFCQMNIIAKIMEWKDPVVGEIRVFSHLPKKKSRKGCQKGWKTKFLQIRFSAHPLIGHCNRSTPVVFWGEKMLWLGCGGSIRENPVPNLDCDSAQATGEVRLTPNFANHLVMLFKYGLHQKSHIPGLLLGQPPLKFCNRIIRPNLFNTVKYALNTIRHITQIRCMTHPCQKGN